MWENDFRIERLRDFFTGPLAELHVFFYNALTEVTDGTFWQYDPPYRQRAYCPVELLFSDRAVSPFPLEFRRQCVLAAFLMNPSWIECRRRINMTPSAEHML